MLVLSRKVGEKIYIGHDITLTVVRISPAVVRIGIDAPRAVQISRSPILRVVTADPAQDKETPEAA